MLSGGLARVRSEKDLGDLGEVLEGAWPASVDSAGEESKRPGEETALGVGWELGHRLSTKCTAASQKFRQVLDEALTSGRNRGYSGRGRRAKEVSERRLGGEKGQYRLDRVQQAPPPLCLRRILTGAGYQAANTFRGHREGGAQTGVNVFVVLIERRRGNGSTTDDVGGAGIRVAALGEDLGGSAEQSPALALGDERR